MIADIINIFSAPRSPRFMHGRLSARKVRAAFDAVRKELAARTLHTEVRRRDHASSVIWSLWVGRFEKVVPWLLADRFRETRYAFLLLLEYDGYVGIIGSNIGDVTALVTNGRVSYQKLLALRSDTDTEVESISTRSLRAARVGVTRSTQRGRHLEMALSRVGANQAAPFQLGLRQGDQSWRVSPGSGRVAASGARSNMAGLCAWFTAMCGDIDGATEPSDFIKAFAHAIALDDLPAGVEPIALQLDSTVLDDLFETGATLRRSGVDLLDSEIEALRQSIGALWLVRRPQTPADVKAKIWRLSNGQKEVGNLAVRSTKISLSSDHLSEIEVNYEDGTAESLTHLFNSHEQPFLLTFSDTTYAYTAGQLFRDHRLLASRSTLLEVLSAAVPAESHVEKEDDGQRFSTTSLFGFVVEHASTSDDFLVCDDMGTEWADFVGVSTREHQITFYHCKGGSVDVGASGLHEVVSQATKNLGYLTASAAELDARSTRWAANWNQRSIPRLQRGSSVADFVAAFSRSVAAPQAVRRVSIVTSSLSKAAVAQAFNNIDVAVPTPEVVHVLWLLSGFVDQCRSAGAVPQILCRP